MPKGNNILLNKIKILILITNESQVRTYGLINIIKDFNLILTHVQHLDREDVNKIFLKEYTTRRKYYITSLCYGEKYNSLKFKSMRHNIQETSSLNDLYIRVKLY